MFAFMKIVRQSVIVARPAGAMFALVDDCERYPEFLPWCAGAEVHGPFHVFKGHWRFVPMGETGCRIEFALEYGFSSRALENVLGPVFGHIVETLVDRFVERAESATCG
jgi:ribosome-associated toxin RatA of RatAB toxin-antitoxin module